MNFILISPPIHSSFSLHPSFTSSAFLRHLVWYRLFSHPSHLPSSHVLFLISIFPAYFFCSPSCPIPPHILIFIFSPPLPSLSYCSLSYLFFLSLSQPILPVSQLQKEITKKTSSRRSHGQFWEWQSRETIFPGYCPRGTFPLTQKRQKRRDPITPHVSDRLPTSTRRRAPWTSGFLRL